MKKNPNEDIITAIKIRQIDLAIKATEIAIKGLENPPKTFAKSLKFAGKELQIVMEIAKLQRIKRQLEPKPEMVTIEFMNKDEKPSCTGKPYGKIKGVGYEKQRDEGAILSIKHNDIVKTNPQQACKIRSKIIANNKRIDISEKLYVKDPIIERSKKCYGN